jgi:hypothetical protein
MPRRPFRVLLEATWASRVGSWVGYARHLVGNAADAEDIVQNAVQKTLEANPDLQEEAQLSSYVRTTIRRIVQSDGSSSLASSDTLRPAGASSMICRQNSGGYGHLVFGIPNTSRVSRKVSTKLG